jgi:hypothetical protein
MRSISSLWFGIGLVLLQPCTWAEAQDTPRPAVQVIVGPNGDIRVFDPKTGKEIASVVTKVQTQRAQGQLERARFELEGLLLDGQRVQRVQGEKAEPKKEKAGKPLELEFNFGPGPGKPLVLTLQAPPAAGSLEKKVDLILKNLDELRRDVNQLKSKLEGKKVEVELWRVVPIPAKDGKDKDKRPDAPRIQIKPAPGQKLEKQVEPELRKVLEDLLKRRIEEATEKARKAPPERRPEPRPDRNAELERRLERILREAEELRREILKSKSPAK